MKMTVYKTSTEPNLDQSQPQAGGGTEGGSTGLVWGRLGVVHEMEVCAM